MSPEGTLQTPKLKFWTSALGKLRHSRHERPRGDPETNSHQLQAENRRNRLISGGRVVDPGGLEPPTDGFSSSPIGAENADFRGPKD